MERHAELPKELKHLAWLSLDEVDGQEYGVTPLDAPIQLAAGDHQVRLINPDLGKDVTRTVHIKPSETNTVRVLMDE